MQDSRLSTEFNPRPYSALIIGIMGNLLDYMISVLGEERHPLLRVDFESFNPTAYGFWLKHFTAYTNSLVRRIDESALNK